MKISYLFFFLSITSCSFVGFYQEANPQVSGLLINISNAYFTSLAKKDFNRAEQFVIWGDYAGGNISKEQFFQSANEMVSQTETSELPFMGLTALEVKQKENNAYVKLLKKSTNTEIIVKYKWVGNAWYIVNDSILGEH